MILVFLLGTSYTPGFLKQIFCVHNFQKKNVKMLKQYNSILEGSVTNKSLKFDAHQKRLRKHILPSEKKRDAQFPLNKLTAHNGVDRCVTHACQHVVMRIGATRNRTKNENPCASCPRTFPTIRVLPSSWRRSLQLGRHRTSRRLRRKLVLMNKFQVRCSVARQASLTLTVRLDPLTPQKSTRVSSSAGGALLPPACVSDATSPRWWWSSGSAP